MSSSRHHTTQSHAAYEPGSEGVRRGWGLVVAGIVGLALAAIAVRPVCRPDQAGATESGFGVRHEQRDGAVPLRAVGAAAAGAPLTRAGPPVAR